MIRVILRVNVRGWYVLRVCGHVQHTQKARSVGESVYCRQCAKGAR